MSSRPTDDPADNSRRSVRRRPRKDDAEEGPDYSVTPSPTPAPAVPDSPAEAPETVQAAPAVDPSRPVLDADALLGELQGLDPAEFGRLLGAGSLSTLEAGDEVEGPVVRVTRDTVFVDIGGKSEAWLPRGEVGDDEAVVGASLRALVLGSGAQGVRLTRSLSGLQSTEALESALEAQIPVDGKVLSRNEGGFQVAVAGATAFCPVSQIDRHPDPDLDRYIGQTLSFRVLELRGRDVVVSHRVIAEEEAATRAEELWATLAPGDGLDGVVVSTRPFGVFVDVGGVTGLVHRSELGWSDDVTVPLRGAHVHVRVIDVDREARRVSLSMKDEGSNPWAKVDEQFPVGTVATGKVVRIVDFGAFVELAPGLQGLVHVSNIAEERVAHPSDRLQVGAHVRVRVLGIDHERQRIELGMRQLLEDGADEAAPARRTTTTSSGSLGTLGDLLGSLKLD